MEAFRGDLFGLYYCLAFLRSNEEWYFNPVGGRRDYCLG